MKELTLQFTEESMPLREVVFHTLRNAILTGDIEPGERLMEIKLAQKLGVSRTPIREAIRKLELEGLVVMAPRRGAQVAKITQEDMTQVLEVRAVLEGLAIELACDKVDSEKLDVLREKMIEFEKAVKGGDVVEIATKDVEFHDAIYDAAGNRRLVQILNNLREQMYRYRLEYIKEEEKRQELIAEHKNIVEAIADKNKEKAKESILLHIYNQEQGILESIQREQK